MMPSRPTQPDLAHGAMATAWDNPIPTGRYDLVVLGADRAARWAAYEAASLGACVAWIVGTDDDMRSNEVDNRIGFGLRRKARNDGRTDERWTRLGNPDALFEVPVDVYRGAPHFIAPDALHLAGRRLHFVRALIATSATVRTSDIEGLDSTPWISAEDVMRVEGLFRNVAVIGAGAIGCAAAQSLGRIASVEEHVTIFESAGRILPRESPEASSVIAGTLDNIRWSLRPGLRVVAAAPGRRGFTLQTAATDGDGAAPSAGLDDESGRDVEFDSILVATGRRCDFRALDLTAAAVELDGDRLRLDARLRTTNPRIYAAGDAALDHPSPHGALAMARVALRNALFDGRRRADILTIPRIVSTVPQLASVGLLPHEPDAADVPLDTLFHRLPETGYLPTWFEGRDDVFSYVALHLAAGTDVLLGATLVGPDAATAIGEVAHAIDAGTPLTDLAKAIRPPGFFADALLALADDAHRRRRSPGGRALATRWLAARRSWADRTA